VKESVDGVVVTGVVVFFFEKADRTI